MTQLATCDDAFIQLNQVSSKSSSKHLMFKTAIQNCNISTVKTISSIIKLYKQFEKWMYCMMADVNLFGGRGETARDGVVGRPARGGARNRVPQTDRQHEFHYFVDSFQAGGDFILIHILINTFQLLLKIPLL